MNHNHSQKNSDGKRAIYSISGKYKNVECHNVSTRDTALCSILDYSELVAGESTATGSRFGHDAEMEWCLIFSRPLSKIRIHDSMYCHLQGAIRERQMDPALKARGEGFEGARGRSIIAMNGGNDNGDFGGLKTTILDLTAGKIYARMRLEYVKENMREKVDRTVSSSILLNIPLILCLKHLQQLVRKNQLEDSNIVRLHPPANHGGYLQERWLKYRSAFVAIKGNSGRDVMNSRIWEQLISDIITKKEYIKSGTTANLSVFDGKGVAIGTSVLEVA